MLGPNTPQTPLDRSELTFHAARLLHPDITIAGVLNEDGQLVAVEFTHHQHDAQVLGDARVLDTREPVGSGAYDLDETLAPLDITHERA